jgi:hypothetical protein
MLRQLYLVYMYNVYVLYMYDTVCQRKIQHQLL